MARLSGAFLQNAQISSASPRAAPQRVHRLLVEVEADGDGVDVQVQYNALGRTCRISLSSAIAKPATLRLDGRHENWRRFMDAELEEDLDDDADEDALLRNSMLMQREEASHSTAFQSEIVCLLAANTKHERVQTTSPKCSLEAASSLRAWLSSAEDARERMIMSL